MAVFHYLYSLVIMSLLDQIMMQLDQDDNFEGDDDASTNWQDFLVDDSGRVIRTAFRSNLLHHINWHGLQTSAALS